MNELSDMAERYLFRRRAADALALPFPIPIVVSGHIATGRFEVPISAYYNYCESLVHDLVDGLFQAETRQ